MALTEIPSELSSTPSIVDNGNATAITIDSSENATFAGSVGIGTAPTSQLEIDESGSGDATIKVGNAQNVQTTNVGKQGASAYGATAAGAAFLYTYDNDISIMSDGGTGSIKFTTGGNTQKMELSAAGNLLVGKSALEYENTAGHIFRNDGLQSSIRSGGNVADFNRLSSPGEIIRLSADGATVGSIGTTTSAGGSRFAIGGVGDPGIIFAGTGVFPAVALTASNNTIDLGSASYRWRDIFLSGGVNFSANANAGGMTSETLDDYEEGNFTPTIVANGGNQPTIAYGHNTGTYTKVGRLVTLIGYFQIASISGTTSGNLNITGLPFLQLGGNGYAACGAFSSNGLSFARTHFGSVTQYQAHNMGFLTQDNNGAWSWELVNILSAGDEIRFSISYHTAA